MAPTTEIQSSQRLRMANDYEAIVLGMALLRGDRLSDAQKGLIVNRALAATSPEEFRNPGTISAAAVGQLHQFLIQTLEAGKPRNDFGADAARAAQAAGGPDGQRSMGFGYIDALRGSSSRYRDLPAGDSVKGTGTAVTAEFARSFAGTGMVGGTLRTFAEVGLDRGTFNAFRREGFSREQIVDSARDSKALHFKGKEDLAAAQHAPVDLRKAAVAVEQAKTPEDKATKQEHEAGVAKKYEALPDGDHRKDDARRFIQRLERRGHHVELGSQIGTGAKQDDAHVAKDHSKISKASHTAVKDGLMVKGKRQSEGALTANIEDDFGAIATPAPSKPVPIKVAAAKLPPAALKPNC